MGSNNNKKTTSTVAAPPAVGYGANPGQSSSNDPKGRSQNSSQYQQQRYESQQGPVADSMAYNYGRGTESDYGNYTDIMNNYRDIASGGGSGGGGGNGGGGGGGGGGYTPQYNAYTVDPERVSAQQASVRSLNPLERVKASDPFESYKGFQEFGQTGGYSGTDIADLRARGVAPIRAAYANAERNIGQQRGLQGGYSPNAIAAQIKMAREQGQGMADANQNVNAGIVDSRNQGRLAGFGGMAGIEGQRLNAQMQGDIFNAGQANEGQKFDIGNEMSTSQFNAGQGNDVGKFNADLGFRGQQYNADAYTNAEARNNAAAEASAARGAAASAQSNADRFRALEGMSNLYGTTPGMSNMFGNQVTNIVGQGGNFGLGLMGREMEGQQQPGQYDITKGKINDALGYAGAAANVGSAFLNNRNQNKKQDVSTYNKYGYSG